jgi:hypothetical protein
VQVQDGATDLGDAAWVFPTGTPAGAFAEAFDGVSPPALPAGWTSTSESGSYSWTTVSSSSDTAPNSAFLTDPSVTSLTSLVSPAIAVPTTSASIVLTFRHWYSVESYWDGGVLELKIGAGAFQDVLAAGGSFVEGGYTHTLLAGPLSGRQAWSGSSSGYGTTTINLPAMASGQTIQLRWRLSSDGSVGGTAGTSTISSRPAPCCVPTTPSLSVDDVSVVEGDAGTTTANFTVTLSPASAAR